MTMSTNPSDNSPGRGVMYLSMGSKHAARLVVSLLSLRRHYHGEVLIVCPEDAASCDLAWSIARDQHIDALCISAPLESYRRHSAYVAKSHLHEFTPFAQTVFLDADTLVTGPLHSLWPLHDEVVLTRFADWVSTGRTVSARVSRFAGLDPARVDRALARPEPAVNTGVFAYAGRPPLMREWSVLTRRNPCFICDEIAMQVLYPDFPHRLLDERHNRSPRYGSCPVDEVVIWHGHGDKHLYGNMKTLWLEVFATAMALNVGGIRQWAPAGDKMLRRHLRAHPLQ